MISRYTNGAGLDEFNVHMTGKGHLDDAVVGLANAYQTHGCTSFVQLVTSRAYRASAQQIDCERN